MRLCALLVSMLLLGGTAAAQPAAPVAPAAACAVAADDSGRPDEALYNAGVCHEEAGAADDAIAAFQALRTRFPRSPLAARTLLRLGALYARSARYAEAAALLEQYARAYPAEPDADRALSDAVYYRKGLGDDVAAIADTRYFIRAFGARRPAEAAAAFFDLGAIYEQRGKKAEVVAHYRAYLKTYGAKGGADRVVIAYARIGQVLWDQSCRVEAVDGSCVRVAPAHPAQCGPASKRAVTAVERDRRQVKEAMAAFAAAIAQYERAGGRFTGGDEVAARYHYAVARFHRTEADYEAYLGLAIPTGLDFDPAHAAASKKSMARFSAWVTAKQRLGARATDAYGRLMFEVKDPATTIAAAARSGQIARHFADALYTAEIPAFIRAEKTAVEAYCDTLTSVAEPLERTAIDAFAMCLKSSTDVGWFSSWSALCERVLGELRPDEYPAATELRAHQAPPSTIFDLEPPVVTLP